MNCVVIMSVYKNDKLKYLKEALESLYAQTIKEFDIFVQCDGKLPDELNDFLKLEYESKKITFLNKRDENKGLAYSLNELLEIVLNKDYEYIARMDADDISVNTRLEKQIEVMKKNIDIDVCGGYIEEFNMDTNQKQLIKYPELNEDILQGMKRRNSMAHVTTLIRRRFFIEVGLYDSTKFNEDMDLWIRGFQNNRKFYNIQETLVKVRTNNAFFNRRRNMQRALEVMKLKFKATRLFGFGYKGYAYAVAHFILFMLPGAIKQFIYRNMR
ncbi:glycosyltransferase [Sulfurimonas sp. HSL-1716]|uniref:glycosyltransferase n=1 Tax=Hydrocurvibacter sulfurireducens TaxID=3131937 RepID=UPI0031F8BE31